MLNIPNQRISKIFLIFFCHLFLCQFSYSIGTWTYKGIYGGGACDFTFRFTIGNTGYVGGGRTAFTSYKNDFWEFDPVNNIWIQKASFPGGNRGSLACFSINGKGYAGLGFDGSSWSNDFWEYDPQNNQWNAKANFPSSARYGTVYFAINNLGYVGLGYDGNFLSDFWEFNPVSNSWLQKSTFPGTARTSEGSFAIGNSGFLAGGYNGTPFNDLWEYIPSNDQWIQRASLPGTARRGHSAFTINNIAYVGLGYGTTSYLVDFWSYNPTLNQWNPETNFGGVERYLSSSFSVNGKAYIITGSRGAIPSPTFSNDVWEFDPMTSSLNNEFGNNIHVWIENSLIHIRVIKDQNKQVSLIVTDLSGKVILSEKIRNVQNHQTFTFKNGLSEGIYLYRILAGTSILKSGKIFKN